MLQVGCVQERIQRVSQVIILRIGVGVVVGRKFRQRIGMSQIREQVLIDGCFCAQRIRNGSNRGFERGKLLGAQ